MTPDRTDALDCLAVRNATIDELLGQSEEPVASAARLHVAGCADCRREVAGIRATIARLRRETVGRQR